MSTSAPPTAAKVAGTPRRELHASVRRAIGILAVAAGLGIWQLLGDAKVSPYLPPMSAAMSAAWGIVTGEFSSDIVQSIGEALLGLIIGSLVGAVVGMVVGYGRLHHWLRPVLEFQRAVPIIAVAPIALTAFKPGFDTRIGIIALASFWPVFVNAEDATRAIDPRWIETARSCGYSGPRLVTRVIAPGALPMILAGVRIAISVALLAMVVSQFFLATSGLGYEIQYDATDFDYSGMFGAIVILAITGRLMSGLFGALEKRVTAWYIGQKGLVG